MIGVAITTRNEAATIMPLVVYLKAAGYAVVVSDAASTDGTPEIAEAAGAKVIRHAERISIRDGLLECIGELVEIGALRIVTIDAGGSHLLQDLRKLLAVDADLVIGSRFTDGSRYEGRPARALCSRLAAIACNIAQPGASYSDWTSGYRVWNWEGAEQLRRQHFAAQMHGWQIESLAWAGSAGFTIAEVPITYRAGRSSMNSKIAREALAVWWRMWRSRGSLQSWVKVTP